MAGICAGPGLTTDEDGQLQLFGPVEEAWNEADCVNALRVDPGTGKLWAPRARLIHARTTQPGSTATPTLAGTFTLTTLDHEQTAPACSDAKFVALLTGGYLGQRMGSGNWWAVRRYITVELNGAPVAFTGLEPVGGLENNSGGVLGASAALDATVAAALDVPAGQTVRVLAHYEHTRLTFTASAANSYDWRPPVIDGFMFVLES